MLDMRVALPAPSGEHLDGEDGDTRGEYRLAVLQRLLIEEVCAGHRHHARGLAQNLGRLCVCGRIWKGEGWARVYGW